MRVGREGKEGMREGIQRDDTNYGTKAELLLDSS